MAIEEEFSIEIPDKEADAIHSGKLHTFILATLADLTSTVDQAITYICAQPDAH